MTPLTELIIDSGNSERFLTVHQLEHLITGGDARRYGLVNRALKSKELIKARRGLYVLSNKYRRFPPHPFALAQQWQPSSYISVETALSFHGWLPEAVLSTVSMTHGGKSTQFNHEIFGQFEFRRMAVNQGSFLQAVVRHELQHQIALIAEPIRALLDLVYCRKLKWQGLGYLVEGLRIEETLLRDVPLAKIKLLFDVYKGERECDFIKNLLRVLNND